VHRAFVWDDLGDMNRLNHLRTYDSSAFVVKSPVLMMVREKAFPIYVDRKNLKGDFDVQ
jgi:hypothetical protein